MNKTILLVSFLGTIMSLFGSKRIVKPEELSAYAGIQAFSKQPAVIKPSFIHPAITHPEKLHFPMTFDDRLATDGLLIFLDNTEEKLKVVAQTLLFALNQKVCPILASAHLLKVIEETPSIAQFIATLDTPEAEKIRQYFDALKNAVPHFIDENPNASQKEISKKINDFLYEQAWKLDQKYKGTSIKDRYSDIRPYLLKEFTPWDQNEWLIKAVDKNQQLLLLIPRNYMFKNRSEKVLSDSISLPNSAPLTAFEYKTGLKLDHMQTVTDYYAAINAASKISPDKHFMEPLLKSDIFVSRAEYTRTSLIHEQPRWALDIIGHGGIGQIICGLSIPAFSQMLEFLDIKINTAFLTYFSCYTVGTNQKHIYKDLERPTKLSFPIATAAVFDDMTASAATAPWKMTWVNTIDFQNKTLKVNYYINFKQFIDLATAKNPDIALVASTVKSRTSFGRGLVPHIRLGSSEWFTIDDANHKIATIGIPFSQTCTKVDLAKKFTKKGVAPNWFCLYSPIIPCELTINTSNYYPAFFPMSSLKTPDQNFFMYYIKKLSTPHLSLETIKNMFTRAISDKYKLIAEIDEIELKEIDDRIFYAEPQIIKDVLIIHNKPVQNVILFTAKAPNTTQTSEPTEKFYMIDFNKPILEKQEIGDFRFLKKTFGFTDAIKQFEKEKREPAKALETILKKQLEKRTLSESASQAAQPQ